MAATCTYTVGGRRIKIHTWAWKSHTDGSVAAVGSSTNPIKGIIKQVEFIPNANSGFTPTSGYSTKLVDGKNFDWLFGVGASICPASGAQAQRVRVPMNSGTAPILNGETLLPSITGAGDTKYGDVRLTVEDFPVSY